MELRDYQQIYFDFETAISQTQLISLCATEAMKDFPSRLPPGSQEAIANVFIDAAMQIAEAVKSSISKKDRRVSVNTKSNRSDEIVTSPYAPPLLSLLVTSFLLEGQ